MKIRVLLISLSVIAALLFSGLNTPSIKNTSLDIPRERFEISIPTLDQFKTAFRPILNALLYVITFDWLIGRAEAACTGGTCFWIGGSGSFSDGSHWSTTSGGAACSCIPTSTDALVFDANSGGGTATQDNAIFTSGSVNMASASISVSGSMNTWNVGGSWNDGNFKFAIATSFILITVSGTITTNGAAQTNHFYRLTIQSGVTATLSLTTGIRHEFTVNGTITGALVDVYIGNAATHLSVNPLILGGSASITGVRSFNILGGGNWNLTGGSFPNLSIGHYVTVAASTATAQGTISIMGTLLITGSGNALTLAMGTNALIVTSTVTIGHGCCGNGRLTGTSGSWTTGSTTIGTAFVSITGVVEIGNVAWTISNGNNVIIDNSGTLDPMSGTISIVNGTWDSSEGVVVSGFTQTATFNFNGTCGSTCMIKTNSSQESALSGPSYTFYNLNINAGASVRLFTSVWANNNLFVNGTVIGGNPYNVLHQWGVHVKNANPVSFGTLANMIQSGMFTYSSLWSVTAWNVTGGTYNFLNIFPAGLAGGDNVTLQGDIIAFSNGSHPVFDGEIIMAPHEANLTFRFNQNGKTITSNGDFFVGDTLGRGVEYYLGSGIINANNGLALFSNTEFFMETGTVNVRPQQTLDPIAFYMVTTEDQSPVLRGGSGTMNIHGAMRIFSPGLTQIDSQNATWNVFRDFGNSSSGIHPGDVIIDAAGNWVEFDASLWVVDGNWTSGSTSPSWSGGTRTITFTAPNVIINGTGTKNVFPNMIFSGNDAIVSIQTIWGTRNVTSPNGSSITITSGLSWTLNGTVLSGGINDRMNLHSSIPGQWHYLNATGLVVALHIWVSDSNASGGNEINAGSVTNSDGGNNVNWRFYAQVLGQQALDFAWIVFFIFFMTLGLIGAWKIRKWRGGDA